MDDGPLPPSLSLLVLALRPWYRVHMYGYLDGNPTFITPHGTVNKHCQPMHDDKTKQKSVQVGVRNPATGAPLTFSNPDDQEISCFFCFSYSHLI